MAARKGGLGRGLDALIPQDHPSEGYGFIAVNLIDPNPNQPREEFDLEADAVSGRCSSSPLMLRERSEWTKVPVFDNQTRDLRALSEILI